MNLQTNNDIYELLETPRQLAALTVALRLGLFWFLADRPYSTAVVASEKKIPPVRCYYWLSMLANMNLLEQEGDQFKTSPLARSAFLDVHSQEAWAMLAVDAEDGLEAGLLLAQRICDPGPEKGADGRYHYSLAPYVQKMAADLERARQFSRLLYELHTPLAQHVADALDIDEARSMMDVGGGSGVISLALLQKHPALKSTVVDIANVCVAGREIADEVTERDRISYLAANFVEDELPRGFDIVLVCDVGMLDDAFLTKLAASLNDGGRLVIVDRWFQTGERETSSRLAFLLSKTLLNPEYSLRSLEDIQQSLVEAGLSVEKNVELKYNRWRMIQARKDGPV